MAVRESGSQRARRGGAGALVEERSAVLSGDQQSGLLLCVERTTATGASADGAVCSGVAERAEPAGFLRRDYADSGRLSGGAGTLPEGSGDQPALQPVASRCRFDVRFDGR